MSVISTIKDMMTEKATDFVFSKFTEILKDKELKDKFKTASHKYFSEIFENCDLSDEFDFEAVETYLLNNLDKKIVAVFYNIKNIGREGRDSIREDILHGAVARGNGNEKAIRKYCNSIIDFVGACLHDEISDGDKILVSEITSVTNEHYKRLVGAINDVKDIGREVLNEIEYFGSFAEQIDTIGLQSVITKNKFSYTNPSVGFYGRNAEQDEIEKFMSDDRPLLFWSIVGRGGVGKSKFALHICKKYKKENWKSAWLNKDKIESINKAKRNNGYNKPLLLICDYAGEYIELIRTLLFKFLDNTQYKIRVLLLERSGYTQTRNNDHFSYLDTWYNRLLSGHGSDKIKEIEYLPDSLNLDNYVLTDEDMFNILDDFSEKKLSEKNKKAIVDFTKSRLNSVSDKNNLSQLEERCLFLLFTADAFLNGNDYKCWDTKVLMDKYTERFKTNLEAHYKPNICVKAYTLLAVASAIGTIDIESVDTESIFGCYISPIKDELSYNFDINDLKMFLSALCEKDTADLNIYPMLPDLVGEFFFIDIFSRNSPEYQHKWYEIFCSERYQEYFCSFLRRCLDDWHSLENYQNIIKKLFEFAKVNNYKGFIRECVNNSFFIGLSYYYTLTENDLLWLKNILLISKSAYCYLEYACILSNMAIKMSNAEDILKIANQIKDEVLSKYGTAEIAEQYARVLISATVHMSNAEDILKIANQIKDEILSEYDTAEIAGQYARALISATVHMSNACDVLKIANQIKDEILSRYGTAKIAEQYALALVSLTIQMFNAEDRLKTANQIKDEILSEYRTAEIALWYAVALGDVTNKMSNVEDILKIANQIKDEVLSKYGTAKIALRYAIVLFNASAEMSNVEDRLKIANQIKDEVLSKYGTAEIALRYAMVFTDATIKMSNAEDRLKIANQIKDEVLSEYVTAEIALQYAMALVNASAEMSNAEDRLKIANQIKDEVLSKYGTAEIALRYAMALVNATNKMSNAEDRLKIADRIKNILIKYDTKEIAEVYVIILKYVYSTYHEYEYLLEEIETVHRKYGIPFDNE